MKISKTQTIFENTFFVMWQKHGLKRAQPSYFCKYFLNFRE